MALAVLRHKVGGSPLVFVGLAVEVQVEVQLLFAFNRFGAGVLEAESIEQVDDGLGVEAGVQYDLEIAVMLAVCQRGFHQPDTDRRVLPIFLDA